MATTLDDALHDGLLQEGPEDTQRILDDVVSTVFENSQFAVIGINASGRIGYWNSQCNELFQLPEDLSLEGRHGSELLCGGDRKCASHRCEECAIRHNFESEKQIYDYQLSIRQADGKDVRVNIATCYIYQNDPDQISTYFSIQRLGDSCIEGKH